MRRRDFVKGILAAGAAAQAMSAQQAATPAAQATPPAASTAIPPLPPQGPVAPGPMPWNRGLLEAPQLGLSTVVPDAVAETNATFFTEAQTATLRRMCALLMPPLKGYPGAIETGTPEFLDFLIGASPRRQQQMYKAGLDWLDTEAKLKFAVSFEKTTDAQADALLKPWLRTWMTDHAPTEPHAGFINQAHSDIRTATMNSQEWSDAQAAAGRWRSDYDLYWYPVDPNLHDEPNAALRRPAMPAAHA
jgi:hypothetical protein